MSAQPRAEVSVVVPHHGDPAPTLRLLDCLAAQRDVVAEVVVVDDASPQPFPDDPRACVVRREVNGGFGSAVNTGVERTHCPLLLVLNSDVAISATFLAELLAASTPWLPAVVSPRVVDTEGRAAWTGRRFPSAGQQAVEWLSPLARFRDRDWWHRAVGHDLGAHGRTAEVDWVVGAAMLLPTEDFRAVGGFDERFHMNAEEIDLQRRLRERGIGSVVLAEPTLVHSGGGSSDPTRRRGWLVDARLAYAAKWGGRRRLQSLLALATGANLVVNGVRRAAGRDVAPWRTARAEWALLRGSDPACWER